MCRRRTTPQLGASASHSQTCLHLLRSVSAQATRKKITMGGFFKRQTRSFGLSQHRAKRLGSTHRSTSKIPARWTRLTFFSQAYSVIDWLFLACRIVGLAMQKMPGPYFSPLASDRRLGGHCPDYPLQSIVSGGSSRLTSPIPLTAATAARANHQAAWQCLLSCGGRYDTAGHRRVCCIPGSSVMEHPLGRMVRIGALVHCHCSWWQHPAEWPPATEGSLHRLWESPLLHRPPRVARASESRVQLLRS
jgi:hypothetical protein